MDFSYVHIRYFIGYVYHICLQDTIQSTLSLCLLCQAMLLPMPLRPLLLTTRSGFNVVWVGRGWGFIPCFSLTLSPFSFTLRPCVRLGMRAWCAPLAPSFVLLTYLFAFSLFPHGPWPPHTFCASVVLFFFRRVSRGAWSLSRNMADIWLWFVFVGMPFDVRGRSSFFFACGVVPWAPSFATYLVFSSTHV